MCGCSLELQSVMYQFWGHCDLDLVSRIIMSRAYPILFEVGIPIGNMDTSLDGDMLHTNFRSL